MFHSLTADARRDSPAGAREGKGGEAGATTTPAPSFSALRLAPLSPQDCPRRMARLTNRAFLVYHGILSLHFVESQTPERRKPTLRTDYIAPGDLEAVYRALTPQNELVLRVCEETGIRVSDALSIRTDELKQRFTITEMKTGKRRRIRLRAALLDALKASAGRVYVFEGRLSAEKHRTRQAVWKDLKRAAEAFRIKANIAPHSVRKTYAVELARRGYSPETIQHCLNHESAAVTALYLMAGLVAVDSRPAIKPPRRPRVPKGNPGQRQTPQAASTKK